MHLPQCLTRGWPPAQALSSQSAPTISRSRKCQSAARFPATWRRETFGVWTLSKHIHPSKSTEGAERRNPRKGTSVWILRCWGRKPANESQWLAITAAVLTCRNLPGMTGRGASRCCCGGTPSPGAVWRGCYWFLLETASLLKPRPSGRRIREVSDQTTWKFNWRWLSNAATLFPLNATCFIYSRAFHHSRSLDLQITSHLIMIADAESMIQRCTLLTTFWSTERIDDVYQSVKRNVGCCSYSLSRLSLERTSEGNAPLVERLYIEFGILCDNFCEQHLDEQLGASSLQRTHAPTSKDVIPLIVFCSLMSKMWTSQTQAVGISNEARNRHLTRSASEPTLSWKKITENDFDL